MKTEALIHPNKECASVIPYNEIMYFSKNCVRLKVQKQVYRHTHTQKQLKKDFKKEREREQMKI